MMMMRTFVCLCMAELFVMLSQSLVESFTTVTNHHHQKLLKFRVFGYVEDNTEMEEGQLYQQSSPLWSSTTTATPKQTTLRRDECLSKIFNSIVLTSTVAAASSTNSQPAAAADEAGGVTVFKNPSGLKFIELKPGTGLSPRYGQLCSIEYTAYLKLPQPDAKPQKFDSTVYLIKHGNGKTIPGLDEGLHTMKVGGIRRLIIPPKLGYIESGLGPVPEFPWNRWKLNSLLEQMIQMKGGNLIFEVELLSVIDDEADQGYYEDKEPSAAELEFIQTRLMKQSSQAAQQAALEAAEAAPAT